MTGPRRNLLIVRAGDKSLHPGWIAAEGDTRSWDLHISYFGQHAQPFGALPSGVTLSREIGGKYSGLSACLAAHPQYLEDYDYIGFPDDDLQIADGSWSGAFATMAGTGAVVGQPALDHRSFYSHPVTLKARKFQYREVNFIEVMMPIFRTDFLKRVIPEFLVTPSSWGLDFVYSDMALKAGERMIVDDRNTILHTRQIGKGVLYADGSSPEGDLRALLDARGLVFERAGSLVGVRENGRRIALSGREKAAWSAKIYNKIKRFMGLNVIMT